MTASHVILLFTAHFRVSCSLQQRARVERVITQYMPGWGLEAVMSMRLTQVAGSSNRAAAARVMGTGWVEGSCLAVAARGRSLVAVAAEGEDWEGSRTGPRRPAVATPAHVSIHPF